MQEKTWILRHRILEDSLVVAEQQSESGSHWCFSSLPRNGNHVGTDTEQLSLQGVCRGNGK
jgi:hypothetical protein